MINKKKLSIIAGILFIIGIAGSLITYRFVAPEPFSEEKVINNKQVSIVNIDTDNVRVNISPATDNMVKVTLDGKTSYNIERSFASNVKDSTLFITYNEKQRSWINLDIFDVLEPITLNVYLPEKQYDSLKVSSDNGYIFVKQLKVTHFDINTDNGRVELKDIYSQNIHAESNNGRMDLKDIMAQNIQVKTDNGRIILDRVEGKLEGKTNNGSISLITEELDRNINFDTNNGSISIKTEKEPTNVQFNVSVGNGKVNILNKYNGNAVIGNGENLIMLTTHNGSISVLK
ncbi:DUF4097 and DUF4098 domain-containing protein YvlB [Anoxybacillus calidus]|jgi:DUF4097 and DUF4098 domain-containing protein YvlB|uniref:DUF4097 and DUF4098 domain-containing protein YvlB n=1 Tax=[Anoxybacillus] calidus TaxID=575178 RepID=A0A7W0BV63_9BACL|nr:DUF4097 family beta strand repeat-containing protein [Anoxybacillus calidus]MBA2871195.1 DUF4097 and DUF4098 domain-containing protein YvlB [Anoxybacillus calidus]